MSEQAQDPANEAGKLDSEAQEPEPEGGGDVQGALDREATQKDHPSEVIRSLARAARSFVTYDARNETVRKMISDYRETVEKTLEHFGDLEYEVHPFDLTWKGEVVYSEKDRERSLAFRLFRDGVRAFTFKVGVSWDELLRVLEILSVRYVGIRQHEEDTLTLLRQANLKSIEFRVVEAYVPAEENPEGALDRQTFVKEARPPADWDLPLPSLQEEGKVQYRELTEEELALVHAEATHDAMATAAKQVAREMLSLAGRAKNDTITSRVLTLIEEICKYMIVELRPKDLVWVLREVQNHLGDAPGVKELNEQFGQGEVLDRFLRDPDDVLADELMPLFALVGGDHLDRVIDRFIREEDQGLRNALKTILARLAMGNPDALLNKLGEVPTTRVVDLFNVVCVVAPMDRVMEAAYSLAAHESPEVKLGALEVLAGAKVDSRFHETFQMLLASDTPRVRVKASNIYGQRGGSKAFTRLRDQLETLAKTGLDQVEAAALGKGLMLSSRSSARPYLRNLAKMGGVKGLVQRVKFGEGYHMLRWASVAGLAVDPSQTNRGLLEQLSKRSSGELAAFCREALEQMPMEVETEREDSQAEAGKASEQGEPKGAKKAAPSQARKTKEVRSAKKTAPSQARKTKEEVKSAKKAAPRQARKTKEEIKLAKKAKKGAKGPR